MQIRINEKNEILRFQEEHSYNYWLSVLLRDHKEFIEELFYGKPSDSFDRIMYFFASDSNNKDLEDRPVAKAIYEKLGWNSNYYDVINSFWITFACSIVNTGSKDFKDHYKFTDNLPRLPYPKYSKGENKRTYPKEYLTRKDKLNQDFIKIINESREIQYINKFALLCHSAANFMPCPSKYEKGKKSYNQLKGILADVRDYLPLMIDKIQQCIDSNQPLKYFVNGEEDEVSLCTIKEWKEWFEVNYKNYFLEDYYVIDYEKGRIKGKPLFKNQKLSYPIPRKNEEIEECIKNIITITQRRADLMAKRIIYRIKELEAGGDVWV
ncbi:hypothetical protein M3204_22405 [Mesobacillus subterraneus]|uniref:hypothetical protein n=1 Tax=Mesobacillus subterraneus TaxID=285983 RepID=UPI00203C96CA|nr:hypothetical protein [Mesobacillus subterraneus]MCM3667156.1 hypothetical protein [Mesobacillus subterraneus]MCM3685977.1 hypothetical protein [Mesobacillus subterraneus]